MSDYDCASIHGLCFDNGMAGKCDCDCQVFLDGDCDAGGDVIEGCQSELDWALIEHLGELQFHVMRAQTKKEITKKDEFEMLCKYFGY